MDNGVETFGIISPEESARSFEIGGVVYRQTDTLALGRHRLLEKLIMELQYDASYRGIVTTFDKGWADLEAGRLGSGITAFGLMREKLNLIGANRWVPAEVVALWFLAPDESAASFDYALIKEKCYAQWAALDRDWIKKKVYSLLLSTESRYPSLPEAESETPSPEA